MSVCLVRLLFQQRVSLCLPSFMLYDDYHSPSHFLQYRYSFHASLDSILDCKIYSGLFEGKNGQVKGKFIRESIEVIISS